MIGEDGKRLYEKANDNERYRQPDDSFYSYLNAVIVSSSAKTLAQPTLLVQEGEEAKVEAGESVILVEALRKHQMEPLSLRIQEKMLVLN